jgi:hypothetical protein
MATNAAAMNRSGQSALSRMMPLSRPPIAEANIAVAATSAMAIGTRCTGRCSRARPKHSGRMPPATPWMARPITTPTSVPVEMDTIEPMTDTSSRMISSRRRP